MPQNLWSPLLVTSPLFPEAAIIPSTFFLKSFFSNLSFLSYPIFEHCILFSVYEELTLSNWHLLRRPCLEMPRLVVMGKGSQPCAPHSPLPHPGSAPGSSRRQQSFLSPALEGIQEALALPPHPQRALPRALLAELPSSGWRLLLQKHLEKPHKQARLMGPQGPSPQPALCPGASLFPHRPHPPGFPREQQGGRWWQWQGAGPGGGP